MSIYRGRHTSTLLRELLRRIQDQCYETSREDLVDGLYLIEDMLFRPGAVGNLRQRIIDILSADDELVGAADLIRRMQEPRHHAAVVLMARAARAGETVH